MGLFSKKVEKSTFGWIELSSETQLFDLIEESKDKTIVLFKHSTRCSISDAALARYERGVKQMEEVKHIYLDLIAYRPISNRIAEELNVEHQSPQVIILKNKEVIFTTTHNGINAQIINENL
jgi:bacillithiol system protein YtxJ